MISIITVTYNAERFLERTIRSIVGQENCVLGVDYEYIVIDGGSTDGTLDLIRHHETGISDWQSEPDRGLYDAMNKGQRRAMGDYVWFVNAGDELYDSETLRLLLSYMDTYPVCDVYFSDALFVNDDGSAVGLRSQVTPHRLPTELSWRDMAMGMKVSHQAFVASRYLAPPYPIDNLSADLDWEIRCLKAARRVRYVPFTLCRYLVGGLSVQKHRQSLLDRFRVLRAHFGLWPTLLNHARIVWRAAVHKRKTSR